MTGDPGGGTDFGRVSRVRGAVFERVTLGAALVGVVSLGVLLAFVTVDAFGLDRAGPGWVGIALASLAATVGVLVMLGRSYRGFWAVAGRLVGVLLGGTVLGGAVLVVAVGLDPQVWFAYYTFLVLPVALVTGVDRLERLDRTVPLRGIVAVAVVGAVVATVVRQPWGLRTYPADWLIYVWTLGVPVGAAAWWVVADRHGGRTGRAAAVGVVAGAGLVGLVATFGPTGVDAAVAVVLSITVAVPAAIYAGLVLAEGGPGRAGLIAPAIAAVGLLVGRFLVEVTGAKQPEPWLDWQFLTSAPAQTTAAAGIYPAIVGSVFVIALVGVVSFLLGVGAAIYLEEYAASGSEAGLPTRLIRINISNLAGVPSVVYGLLGLGLFVNLLGLGFGTVVVAALTLSLLILPIVIISAQEAIRSVPDDQRQASYGMGATRWQVVRTVVLPRAMPGVLTGTILALGRAIGETAPLIMIGVPTAVFAPPAGLFARTSAMPMQIFAWADLPQPGFRYGVVAAGVVTLLAVLLLMNSAAILLRNRYQRSR